MSEAARRYMAAEELAFERVAPEKHELVDGQIYAMAGASITHLKITTNTAVAMHAALRGRGCDVLIADFRVHVPTLGNEMYPDVPPQCGSIETVDDGHDDNFLNPSLVVELPSISTVLRLGGVYEAVKRSPSHPRVVREPIADIHAYAARRFRDGCVISD